MTCTRANSIRQRQPLHVPVLPSRRVSSWLLRTSSATNLVAHEGYKTYPTGVARFAPHTYNLYSYPGCLCMRTAWTLTGSSGAEVHAPDPPPRAGERGGHITFGHSPNARALQTREGGTSQDSELSLQRWSDGDGLEIVVLTLG